MKIPAGWRLLRTSGQPGLAHDGSVPPQADDLAGILFDKIGELLGEAGMTPCAVAQVWAYDVALRCANQPEHPDDARQVAALHPPRSAAIGRQRWRAQAGPSLSLSRNAGVVLVRRTYRRVPNNQGRTFFVSAHRNSLLCTAFYLFRNRNCIL